MKNDSIFTCNMNVTHGRGYVYSLQYHIVWCTKYRKPVMTGAVADDVKAYLRKTAQDLNIEIRAMEIMPEHIHMLVDCKPQCCLSDAIKIFKGNVARWLFMRYPSLKNQLWGGHLWNPSYFVATVSERSLDAVEHYINEQKTKQRKE